MAEKTAPWMWQDLDSLRSVTEVTQDHIDRIRAYAVWWDSVESGAAGLAEDSLPDQDGGKADFTAAVEVFMNAATLPRDQGKIRNPFAGMPEDDLDFLLGDTPDATIGEVLRRGEDIEFAATPEDLLLWAEASRGAEGIDPKRPFGSENPSRDIRRLIDPDKALSNAAFAKRRKTLESRQLLMLLFFVQTADLAPGTWQRGDDWIWRRLRPGERPDYPELTRREWIDALYPRHHHECEDYIETIHCLQKLVYDDRVRGSYAGLTRQFKLDNLFDGEMRARHEGRSEDHLRAALRHFPDRRGAETSPWFTLVLVRMLNAQARFAEAREVLAAADLFDISPADVRFDQVDAINCAFLEGIIARSGLGMIGDDELCAILAGTHRAWAVPGRTSLWSFIWDLRHEPERLEESEKPPGVLHARALAAQLELMNGPYDPDREVPWFR